MVGKPLSNRVPNWEARLANYLKQIGSKPFVWGEHDCALMAANAVMAITGVDYASKWRGQYHDALGAARLLGEDGVEAPMKELGFQEIDPAFAKRGDVVMFENDGRMALGVIETSGVYIAAPGPNGLVMIKRDQAMKAWEIA